MSKIIFNTKEAAEYLGLQKGTLEVWRCHGRGPRYAKLGRRVVYTKSDLDIFVYCSKIQTLDSIADNDGGQNGR